MKTESHPPSANFHSPLIEDFADAILNDREPRISGETGRDVARDRRHDLRPLKNKKGAAGKLHLRRRIN